MKPTSKVPKKKKNKEFEDQKVASETKSNSVTPRPSRTTTKKATTSARRKAEPRPKKQATIPQSTVPAGPTDEQIRTRAYFIAERRHRLALPGDAHGDWIEAKRQLLAEFGIR